MNEPSGLEIKHIQIKLSTDEHQILEDKAHMARMKPTPFARLLFMEALKATRGADVASARQVEKNQAWHALLDLILEQGTSKDRDLLMGSLRIFEEALQGRERTQGVKQFRKRVGG